MNSHNNNTKKKPGWNVKEPITMIDPVSNNRVSFTPSEFERLIKQHGVRVKVYRSMFCPNVKSVDDGQHEIKCEIPGCNGSGIVDTHPIETYALIQNQNLEKLALAEGFVDGNSVAATFLIGIELQYFTLVELCDHTDIYFQHIKRSNGNIDVLKYRARRINVILSKKGIEYYQGIDFSIDPNGNVLWVVNRGPETGEIYSIHYEANVQFRATRAMHNNRFAQVKDDDGKIAFVKMPEQWMLAKEFLVKRKDSEGNEILPNLTREVDED